MINLNFGKLFNQGKNNIKKVELKPTYYIFKLQFCKITNFPTLTKKLKLTNFIQNKKFNNNK